MVTPTKKYLLLQIRHDPEVCIEEYQSFLRHSGLRAEQLDVFNIYQHTEFGMEILTGYSALLVGGASEANVLKPEKYPFVTPAIALLSQCARTGFPVFASCYGFQLAVLALGAEVIDSARCHEAGTVALDLTKAATTDPIFAGAPNPLMAVSVHRQSTETLPNQCELLASTAACIHAFRVKGKPFWAFQFHPEVDLQILIDRLTRYQQRYTSGAGMLHEVLDKAVDTPEANALLQKFIAFVEGK